MYCKISIFLAYLMLIYFITSIYYLLVTRNIGTPFNDSLTYQQLIIKKKSSMKRRNIFIQGIIFSSLLCIIIRPFRFC